MLIFKQYSLGFCGYYIIVSCIKASVCFCLLEIRMFILPPCIAARECIVGDIHANFEIVPSHLRSLRYWVYGLCALILSLGAALSFAWLFECVPVLSNFEYDVLADYCVNYDIFRWRKLPIPWQK